jgi:lysophospholipase L1-like esterase
MEKPMNKHEKLLWFIKIIGAFITAFVLLNIFCLLYFNEAIHGPSDTGATDYVWEQNKFYSGAKEGFAFGVTDRNGYNNSFPREQGQSLNIIVMGSSHMEAFQVAQDENATYLLNERLKSNGNSDFAYNIGISGHDFLRCASNFVNALNTFKPTKYVVIETGSVSFDATSVDAALAGTYPKIASHDVGIIGFLQRIPYLRLTYQQLQSFIGLNADSGNADTAASDQAQTSAVTESYRNNFTQLIQKLADSAKNASIKLIVLYHPQISFNSDSSLRIDTNPDYLKLFKDTCNANGIIFADMSDKFVSAYQTQRIVPYGFSNTAAGVGHLNKDGHRMFADIIYDIIAKDESGVLG